MFKCYQNILAVVGPFYKHSNNGIHYSKNPLNSKGVQHPFKIKSKKIVEQQQHLINSITLSNQHEIIADAVTPHWKISYEEELAIKQNQCKNIVSYVLNKVSSARSVEKILSNIIASPVRDAYRNKDEYSIWPGMDGNPKTVGYFVGSPAVGKVVCVPPTHLKCVKESHKELVQLYQEFIRQSPLPVSYQLYDEGFWRNIVIRSNNAGEHMALIVSNARGFTPEQIAEQQEILKDYFSRHAPSVALFHQSCQHLKCTREQAPIHHLSGQPYLMETLSDITFRISPDSFFQQNTLAAELLFKTVIDLAAPKHYSTLLDLYCGVGAVSLLSSDMVRGCVGVERVSAAVEDAMYNAKHNNITNCSFIAGEVESKLAGVLSKLDHSSDIVAVVNPGRGGAGEAVMSLLRQNPYVRRVVYISCQADNPLTLKNFVQLCERIGPGSNAFSLANAIPIDLFPYTNHYELVLCFNKT